MSRVSVFAVATAVAILLPLPVSAADVRPSWDCLPETTVVAVQAPQLDAVLTALRKETRFGAALMDADQLHKVTALLETSLAGGERGDSWNLTQGFTGADWQASGGRPLGFGIVMHDVKGGTEPLWMRLVWVEPGPDAAGRIIAGLEQPRGAVPDGDASPKAGPAQPARLQLAGQEVIWHVATVLGSAGPLGFAPPPPGQLPGADNVGKAKALVDALQAHEARQPDVKHGERHLFAARIEGRLLVGEAFADREGSPDSWGSEIGRQGMVAHKQVDGEWIEHDPARSARVWKTRAELAQRIFAAFLAAHREAGESPLARLQRTPGMEEALADGPRLIDVVIDPRPIVRGQDDHRRQVVESLGFDRLGPLAMRQSLARGRWHSDLFVAAPRPRRGYLALMDQRQLEADLPGFVGRDAHDVTQGSFDFASAYAEFRATTLAAAAIPNPSKPVSPGPPFGPPPGPTAEEESKAFFDGIEAQVRTTLGVELPRLLAAFGDRFWIVDEPPRVAEAVAEARQSKGAVGPYDALVAGGRTVIVWPVADTAMFRQILERLIPLTGGAAVEEDQGFDGVTLPGGWSVFVGHGHVVVANGAGSAARTLTGIVSPPAAEAAVRSAAFVRRGRELLPPRPAVAEGVVDNSHTAGWLGSLCEIVAALEPGDVPETVRPLLVGLQPLLPSATGLEGLFGAERWMLRTVDEGLVLQSVWELPAE